LALVTGCGEKEDYGKVVDAVLVAQDQIHQAVLADPATWTVPVSEGVDIAGRLEGVGSVDVTGWRLDKEEAAGSGFHRVFGEKLFLTFNGYAALDVTLSGSLVATTHSLDFGQTDTAFEDLEQTNTYVGVLTVAGGLSGSFQLDVNGMTTNNTQWTCGTINGEPFGGGHCYER
jgi:hypothetical protein